GVGQIHTPEDACRVLDTGIPLVALGRELLMEPDWVNKVQLGELETIRTTLSLKSQEELVIPDNLWHGMITRVGWLPIEE
ncbi:MAG: NADH-dependent flavin oxidoreductase, partial [Bacteroidota bacterium]|nr:NADH-dependent flavin oxidoreductase [Bacteroidota bacterium]